MEETKENCGPDPYGRGWEHGDHKAMMWHLVKEAKAELLKEKIKKRLEAVEGKKLDEIANMLVEAKMEMRKAKKEFWKKKMEMKEKMMEIFSEGEGEQE
ncbi:MAG TPA: hypothetical protein DSN98_03675 [Thermoplasmata archaeon]|jgi:hypothetical protein|nr:MAG TPA: hypothetical protein DSN98_03675 [Thermoplasmata archaeon]